MYTVERVCYDTTIELKKGYVIEHDLDDPESLFWVNHFLHKTAMSSSGSARQYAYKLCLYLNYLEGIGKTYEEAGDEDIVRFLHGYQYDLDATVTSITQKISAESLLSYYAPVRGLYLHMFYAKQPVNVSIEMIGNKRGRNRYLAGIAPSLPKPDLVIDKAYRNGAPKKDYIKWYTDKEKGLLLENFHTVRDACIFSISLDGFRIDEILSSRLDGYDPHDGTLTPYRSKRKGEGRELRCATLSQRSLRLLEDYLMNERYEVQQMLEDQRLPVPDEIFLNGKGEHAGEPVQYANWLAILKRCAKRAGFNPERIRTHSGRSTRANEVFRDRDMHPDRWNDEEIKDMFGWSSMDSAEPYIHHNDPLRHINTARKLRMMDEERRNGYEDEFDDDDDND